MQITWLSFFDKFSYIIEAPYLVSPQTKASLLKYQFSHSHLLKGNVWFTMSSADVDPSFHYYSWWILLEKIAVFFIVFIVTLRILKFTKRISILWEACEVDFKCSKSVQNWYWVYPRGISWRQYVPMKYEKEWVFGQVRLCWATNKIVMSCLGYNENCGTFFLKCRDLIYICGCVNICSFSMAGQTVGPERLRFGIHGYLGSSMELVAIAAEEYIIIYLLYF